MPASVGDTGSGSSLGAGMRLMMIGGPGSGGATFNGAPASGFASYAGFGRFTITSRGALSSAGGGFAKTVELSRATDAMRRAVRFFRGGIGGA